MKALLFGNRSMIACVICYLSWWIITFKPPAPKNSPAGNVFLMGAFLFGIGGIFVISHGILRMVDRQVVNPFIPTWMIPVAGIGVYAILLFITSSLLHRQVTSELFIIIGWTVLETCLVCTMFKYGIVRKEQLIALMFGIIVVMVLSIICYLLYYKLEYVKGYYDGMAPLVLTGIMMVIINITVKESI